MSGVRSRLTNNSSVNAPNIFAIVTIIPIPCRVLRSIALVAQRLPGTGTYPPLTVSWGMAPPTPLWEQHTKWYKHLGQINLDGVEATTK